MSGILLQEAFQSGRVVAWSGTAKEFGQPDPAAVSGISGDLQETIVCERDEIILVHGIKCEDLFFKIGRYVGRGGIKGEFRVPVRSGEHHRALFLPEFSFVITVIVETYQIAEFKRFTLACLVEAFESCGEISGRFGIHIVAF